MLHGLPCEQWLSGGANDEAEPADLTGGGWDEHLRIDRLGDAVVLRVLDNADDLERLVVDAAVLTNSGPDRFLDGLPCGLVDVRGGDPRSPSEHGGQLYSRAMISTDLAAFLQQGIGIYIGTRNAALEPNGARCIAARVELDGAQIVVYLADVAAARILPDLETTGQAAVTFGRPVDERAVQVKGLFVASRPARDDERATLESQWEGFTRQLEMIGVARQARGAWPKWPATAITLKPTALFEQTPGPAAGQAL